MTACPFKLCSAIVDLLVEQPMPIDAEPIYRVPQHQTGGHEDFGLCPASLMVVPLDDYSRAQLVEQARSLRRIIDARMDAEEREEAAGGGGSVGQPEHQLAPHTDPRKAESWFGKVVRPPLRVLPADGSNTVGGGAVASVEEVKGALLEAKRLAEEARQAVFIAEGQAADALQLVNFARTSSVDPLGAPDLIEAIRVMGEAQEALQRAMAAVVTWVGTR
jgi:hypothetical protein